ncbi:MAG: glycosyltransferase family 2 protein [Chloroflexi bacterium]|nr:glycosyltransferase family 2 protein [Chloroflexota bacterium]
MNVLSVVIPAYNEEDGIAEIIERVLTIRPGLADVGVDDLELIVVDDGSSDKTATITANYAEADATVRLIQQPVNRGYGAALKTGFSQARGNLLGFLDADGTYPPEHFPNLCQVTLNDEIDLVIGSRMLGTDSEMPLVRRIGNFIFANLVSLLGGQRISDSSSGMRVIRREALHHLYPLPDGLNFTPVMSTRVLHEEMSWQEVPIPYKERMGRSKLNVVQDGTRFLYTIIWTAMNYNPVRILGGIGLGLTAIAGIIAAVIIGMRLTGVTQLGPWGVVGAFVASLCMVAGVTLFSLGATFNYLVSLFHKQSVRRGLFGKPIFKHPLERHFGWMGLIAMLLGFVLGAGSLGLSIGGWSIDRLWFWLLYAVMLLMVGLQLTVFWLIMRVLDELNRREIEIAQDMEG